MKKISSVSVFVVFTLVMSAFVFLGNANAQEVNMSSVITEDSLAKDSKLIVYYFYTTARCISCHKIEQYTKEVLASSFADAMASGKIDFQKLNIEDAENKHFVQDYQLYTKSVVLSKIENGKEVSHKNLDKIWNLLRNKEKFSEYIESETQSFLEKDEEI